MASIAADQSVASAILLAVSSAASSLFDRTCCSTMSSNAKATSSPHAKRTSRVQEFIKHTDTTVAHGKKLVKTAGVQENFYEREGEG